MYVPGCLISLFSLWDVKLLYPYAWVFFKGFFFCKTFLFFFDVQDNVSHCVDIHDMYLFLFSDHLISLRTIPVINILEGGMPLIHWPFPLREEIAKPFTTIFLKNFVSHRMEKILAFHPSQKIFTVVAVGCFPDMYLKSPFSAWILELRLSCNSPYKL